MIAGIFHQGSGLGNQLHRYVATRVLALDKGYDFGMTYLTDGSGKEANFKGQSFINIDWGKSVPDKMKQWEEKKVVENGVDIRGYDPEFNFIEDNTIIDGEFQDERYWKHREKEVDEWLKVEPLELDENLCVIGFRGGEYALYPDLFISGDYWVKAVLKIYDMFLDPSKLKLEVHTDDPELAKKHFPLLKIVHDVGINWRSMRYAKYAIIANSSFYILPRWLKQGEDSQAVTIAPRYWARHNTKVWALPQNYYSRFMYI